MRTLNLALQGGGSHGAFTWGVLDALLEDGRVDLEGLGGTSAGAVNAVALASGWARADAAGRDPRDGAREALRAVWQRIAALGSAGSLQRQLARLLWGGLPAELAPDHLLRQAWRGMLSPYQSNPLDINPLRDLLEEQVDFAAVARHPRLKVFVCATHVNTGKAVVFTGDRLDARAVLASACLPMLFHAVEIEGEAYWDGGYSANPPLAPLVTACGAADIALVQINPLRREQAPRTGAEIADRAGELTFNASLLSQLRAIAFINRLVDEGAVEPGRCKRVRLHRIEPGPVLDALPASSRMLADGAMIDQLFEAGRSAGRGWLDAHFDAIGRRDTVDIAADYLDDTRFDLLPAAPGLRSTGRGFRAWVARLLRRGAAS